MTIGSVRPNGDVFVQVTIEGREDRTLEAVLDTGFNGFLALPPDELERLGLEQLTETRVQLASGEMHSAPTYQAVVRVGGEEGPRGLVEIIRAGEALVGTALLWGCEVCIRFMEGGRVDLDVGP